MKRLLLALGLVALASPAPAQNAITQEGSVLQNSPVMFRGNNRARQGAPVGGAPTGQIVTTGMGIAGGICDYSAPLDASGGYYRLCLDAALGRITMDGTKTPQHGLSISINDSIYSFPGSGGGSVVGPTPTTVGSIAFWNDTLGTTLSDRAWLDDGTRLIAPPGRNLTLKSTGGGGGALQVGGVGGPMLFAQEAFEDTLIIQAQPGALPSTNTTNLQLFAPVAGGKSFINFSDTSITPPDESRMIIGYNGPDFWIANVLAGAGTARNICVLDGKGPEFTACFAPRASPATFPYLDLGPQVALRMTNSVLSEQEVLRVDTADNLLVGGGSTGSTLKNIAFMKPLASVGAAPTISGCGTSASVFSGGTNTKGMVVVGTGAPTSCSVVFNGSGYSTAPSVTLTGYNSANLVFSLTAISGTGFTFGANGVAMSGASVMYHVIQ